MINNNLKRVKPVFLNIFWEYCQQNTLEIKLRIMKVNRNIYKNIIYKNIATELSFPGKSKVSFSIDY